MNFRTENVTVSLNPLLVSIILKGFCICRYIDYLAILYLGGLISTIITFTFWIGFLVYRGVTNNAVHFDIEPLHSI